MNTLLDEGGNPKYTNRLSTTTSPYLLQHAHNPVDWYPWGEEALAKARAEDKPILISIGYAACHWCHVMEHESFEDDATAAVMNQHFVNIKVDREERPDLDSIYMSAVQAMTGQGGWPLNCFLLPDGTPFYGGTYYPPDEKASRYRMPSWKQVLLSIADAYQTRRDELAQAGQELLDHLQKLNRAVGGAENQLDYDGLFTNAMQALAQSFDTRHGGFGGAPKFPQPMTLEFLLRHHHRHGDQESLHMLELTLHKMALGGMYDQLGGGFHRYSVDAHWLVPHFEKMLYDNALLARLYVEAHQATGNPFYRVIAEETLAYMQREMLHPAGGFYSTQDADSLAPNGHKEEGEFFVWTPEQVREALGEDAALFCTVYDVSRQGNFEGRNILNLPRPLAEVSRVTGVPVERIREVIQRGREKLFALREGRPKPALDDKVLTAWNGMALRAFATAAATFGEEDYLAVARRNADFLLATMRRADGRLLRNWKDDGGENREPRTENQEPGTGSSIVNRQSSIVNRQSSIPAFLEDYALLADGLLALYQADGDERWLRESVTLADEMLNLFWDEELGGFYDTALDQEQLVVRPRDVGDNATPSGNSVATEVLLRLAALIGNDGYRQRAETVLSRMGDVLSRFPQGFGRMLCAADFASASVKEVAIVGRPASADTLALQRELLHAYRPHVVVAYAWAGGNEPTNEGATHPAAALLEGRSMVDGKATAYVCQNFACQLPVTDAEGLRAQLRET